MAGSSVGVAGGHQRGGHRLLGWSREDLWRAEAVRGQRVTLLGWGGLRRVPTLTLRAPNPAEHSTFAPLRAGPAQPALLGQPKARCWSQAAQETLGATRSNEILQWARRTDKFFTCRLQRRCSSSQDGSLPHPKPPGCLSREELSAFASRCSPPFSADVLMINTSGYPHSLPIHSSAFTVPNFLKASQGALKEDHSSLQASSCSISSLGAIAGCVFCTQNPQSFAAGICLSVS